jgi:hypothetical protein
LLDETTLRHNRILKAQLGHFRLFFGWKNAAILVNNCDWMKIFHS